MGFVRTGLALLAALAAAPAASAQGPGDPAPSADELRLRPSWLALDTNHDGKVTREELPPALAGAARYLDRDGNGEITLAEYVAFDLDPGGGGRMPLAANVRFVPDLPYAGTADPRQRVDVFVPVHPAVPGPLPVIAYVHGGGWVTGSRIMARSQVMSLVDSGRYAAVSIGYRLSWQAKWPAQLDDVKAGVRWIRAHAREYGFDPARICALGASAGGHLVAKLGLTNGVAAAEGRIGSNRSQSSRVECVIDMFGPTDLEHIARREAGPSSVDQLLGGTPEQLPAAARSASPLRDVSAKAPPFLVIHGTADPQVDYQQSVRLVDGLRKAGAPVLFQTVDGGGHGDFGAARGAVEDRVRLFLEHTLYDRAVVVPTDPLHK